MSLAPEPRLSRSIVLQFQGDWGQANLHRICCWLSQEIVDRTGASSRVGIWSGRGGTDAVRAVARGEVDVALATPAAFVPVAITGATRADERFDEVRALGTMPQTDRLVFAIDAGLGIRSFADLRSKAPRLRIALSPDDGVNTVGFLSHRLLQLAGIGPDTIEAWGGSLIERERPMDCVGLVRAGKADVVIHEAIMSQPWRDLTGEKEIHFLPIEEHVFEELDRLYNWPRAVLPSGYLRGIDEPLQTLDFSDFLVIARADLPDDVAYLIAWCMCERREALERTYSHIPPERSPVTYPLVPAKIAKTTIQLHTGARQYYDAAHLL